jgi:hypothetical protein
MSAQANSKWLGALLMAIVGIASGALFAGYLGRERALTGLSRELSTDDAAPKLASSVRNSIPKLSPPKLNDGRPEIYADAPGYKPTDLLGVLPLKKVFEQEPRVDTWATPVERYLSTRMEAELPSLLPGIEVRGVECRTASCRLDLQFSEGPDLRAIKVQQMLAVLYSPAAGEYVGSGDFVLAFRGRTSWLKGVPDNDPDALFKAIEERRTKLIATLKSKAEKGERVAYKHLDPRNLPNP